jgi:hypothetical protein
MALQQSSVGLLAEAIFFESQHAFQIFSFSTIWLELSTSSKHSITTVVQRELLWELVGSSMLMLTFSLQLIVWWGFLSLISPAKS